MRGQSQAADHSDQPDQRNIMVLARCGGKLYVSGGRCEGTPLHNKFPDHALLWVSQYVYKAGAVAAIDGV